MTESDIWFLFKTIQLSKHNFQFHPKLTHESKYHPGSLKVQGRSSKLILKLIKTEKVSSNSLFIKDPQNLQVFSP